MFALLKIKSKKPPSRTVIVSVLTGLLTLIAPQASSETQKPPGLFSETAGDQSSGRSQQADTKNSRRVVINRELLRKGRLFVDLPGGVSFEAVRQIHEELGQGRSTWAGHASENPDDRVVIAVSGDAVAGTFSYRGRLFKLEPRANGSHVLSEVDTKDPAPELDPIPVFDTSPASPDSYARAADSANGNNSVIDILVAYTPAVESLFGTEGAQALVLQAMAETNQAYANSGMATRLNLVHSVLTNYVEANDMNSDLSRLKSTNDGYMDELHTLRDSYGADLVSLIEDEPQYCGLAYRMTSLSGSFASSAFSVVHHSCATGYYSFAHEIGHNQGAHHDTANASGAIFPYAYGYQDPGASFRTVMAYNCPGGCDRVSQFSNSSFSFNSLPTGYANSTENAYAIDETASTVANFRQTVAQVLPVAPTGIGGAATGPNEIDLDWTDTSTTESGFLLERSEDGIKFTEIASVPANTTSHVDVDLQAATTYNYRVRSWNSSGHSDYSNMATATTALDSQHIDQFTIYELSRGGDRSGTFHDTLSVGGTYESITEFEGNTLIPGPFLEHYWVLPVQSGETVTLHADISTDGSAESFTFAYSTNFTWVTETPQEWIDMFTVSAQNPGAKQFTLPASLSGYVVVSVRDNTRKQGVFTQETLNIDYLTIRTVNASGESQNSHLPLPPGC